MKYALVIGNSKYDDSKLSQLKTPEADSRALAKILKSKRIGNFDAVTSLIDQTEAKTRRAINTFLANKKPDDLILLYFSGHGVLDGRGSLFLCLKDTQFSSLNATAISSSFISYEMDNCRSRQQILILDCCNSGAFARGTKGLQKVVTESTFEGNGTGRVVLTASDSTQFAFEGDQVIAQTEYSLFTHFLLEGLKTGKADRDNDGKVSLDEWYDYCHSRITATTPRQVPHKWSYNQQGSLVIAKNPFARKKPRQEMLQLRAMLDQKQIDFQRHKLLLNSAELAIITDGLKKNELELQEADKRMILLSAVVHNDGQKWLATVGESDVELLRQAYQDVDIPHDARLGAVRCLGAMDDEQTYDKLLSLVGKNPRLESRNDWLDLLAQYLTGSAHHHNLPFSLKKIVFPRLVKIDHRKSASERAQISVNSAVAGLFCSLLATILSLWDPTVTGEVPIIPTILYSVIGAFFAVVFAQALTLTTYITRRWLLPWQILTLAGLGSIAGAAIFFFVTAYVQVWFMGGFIGIAQAILSRTNSKASALASMIFTLVVIFAYISIALAEIPLQVSPLSFAFSAVVFSGVYLFSALMVKSRSWD